MLKATSQGFNKTYDDDPPTREQIDSLSGAALLEFGANWCGYCLAARGKIQRAMADHPSLLHIKVADSKGKPLGRRYSVKLWPTLIALKDGVEVARLVRPRTQEDVTSLLLKLTR